MDITYNILKNYETEILPLIEGKPTIENFVQTVFDVAEVKYTFTLMRNTVCMKFSIVGFPSINGSISVS